MNEINRKGYAAESFVECDLTLKGFIALSPKIPGTPYDIVAEKDGRFYKIQIKCGTIKGDKLTVDTRKSKAKERNYTESDYDILAVVNLRDRCVAYVEKRRLGKSIGGTTQLTLWNEMPKSMNGFEKGKLPVLFKDYVNFPDYKEAI